MNDIAGIADDASERINNNHRLADLEASIGIANARIVRFQTQGITIMILAALLLISTVALYIVNKYNKSPEFTWSLLFGDGQVPFLIFLVFASMVCVSVVVVQKGAQLRQDRDFLSAKKRAFEVAATFVTGSRTVAPVSYFDRLVDINVSNLEAYYTLVKSHANNSFNVALFSGCAGFVLILLGLAVGFTSFANAGKIAYLSAGAGMLIEFISGVFFYLYNRTVRQLKDYHDSLVHVQNILLSFKIVGDTKDEAQKNALMGMMMKCLIVREIETKSSLPDNDLKKANTM